MECPCKKCTERTSNCHSTCDKYKNWKAWLNHVKEAERLSQTYPRRPGRWVRNRDGYWRFMKFQ